MFKILIYTSNSCISIKEISILDFPNYVVNNDPKSYTAYYINSNNPEERIDIDIMELRKVLK